MERIPKLIIHFDNLQGINLKDFLKNLFYILITYQRVNKKLLLKQCKEFEFKMSNY